MLSVIFVVEMLNGFFAYAQNDVGRELKNDVGREPKNDEMRRVIVLQVYQSFVGFKLNVVREFTKFIIFRWIFS